MGGVSSLHATAPVQVTVIVPSKGNKVLKNKFMKECPSNGLHIIDFFDDVMRPLLREADGGNFRGQLLRTSVQLNGAKDEIEVDDMSDECEIYVRLGIQKVIFYVEQSDFARAFKEEKKNLNELLVREQRLELPSWMHSGRPALTKLFSELRAALMAEKLGFEGSFDLRVGCEWMQCLVQVMYKLSPFHEKFKSRGYRVPKRFAFSEGADDFKKKGKAAPMLTREIVNEVMEMVQSLVLYSHLDGEEWLQWRNDLITLAECTRGVLEKMENDAAAKKAATKGVQRALSNPGSGPQTPKAADFREATQSVASKYSELNKVIQSYQPYHPLSLSFYEPACLTERYYWLLNLQLSFPIALLKVAVGGSLGTLIWVLKRDADLLQSDGLGDASEIEDARELIRPLIPQVHSRAQRKIFDAKLRGLANMSKAASRLLYKELTGDESEEASLPAKERQAAMEARVALAETFAHACGEAAILADIRSINAAARKGSSCFGEFWACVQTELDSMTQAADERRHSGVVAYLSEVISHRQLFERAQHRFNMGVEKKEISPEAKVPSEKWFAFQFWPANEHVCTALQFTGRFPLKLQLQVRNLRKEHAHAYYCAKQKRLVEEWIIKFRDYSTACQPDDKANGTIGEPGTATAFLARQRKSFSDTQAVEQRAMDHDAGSSKLRFIPSVLLKQNIPASMDGTWLRGQVYVTLKNNLFEASEACKTLAEIKKCLVGECNPNLWLHADGGGEHHVGHPSVVAATICLFRSMNSEVDRIIKTRGCPYHSYLHEVERVMSILNLGLYGVALERPHIKQEKYPGMEHLFVTCKTTADIRAAGKRFPQLVSGLNEALEPLYNLLYERFEQLQLKGTPILRGEKCSSSETDMFFSEIKDLLVGTEHASMGRGQFKRKHLSLPLVKEFMDLHCISDPYKLEIHKGCWLAKLRTVRAEHFGELPEDVVNEVYRTFKCKFGCPPPLTPASVFVEMHEVPRPKKSGTSKYLSFEDTYGTPTPIDLPPLKPGAAAEIAPGAVLDKEKVQGTIKCTWCGRLRCVYVKGQLSKIRHPTVQGSTLQHMLADALEANKTTYTCGSDLDLRGFNALEGLCRPYVRLKLDCSQHMEVQVYSSKFLPSSITDRICGFCGEEGSRVEEEGEASVPLPVCAPCLEQHGKSRPSGRQRARFDRSGQREARAQAAQRRENQVQRAMQNAARCTTTQAQDDSPAHHEVRQEEEEVREDQQQPTRKRRRVLCVDSSDEEPEEDGELSTAENEGDGSEVEEEAGGDNEVPDYFVQAIHKVRKLANKPLTFLVEWVGFPEEDKFTWEPVKNLPNNVEMLHAFKEKYISEGKRWKPTWRLPALNNEVGEDNSAASADDDVDANAPTTQPA